MAAVLPSTWNLYNITNGFLSAFLPSQVAQHSLSTKNQMAGIIYWRFLIPQLVATASGLSKVEPFLGRHIAAIQFCATAIGRLNLCLSLYDFGNVIVKTLPGVRPLTKTLYAGGQFRQVGNILSAAHNLGRQMADKESRRPRTPIEKITDASFTGSVGLYTVSYIALKIIQMRVNPAQAAADLATFTITCGSAFLPLRIALYFNRDLPLIMLSLSMYAAKSWTERSVIGVMLAYVGAGYLDND
jgi:uncharacterized membrane protein